MEPSSYSKGKTLCHVPCGPRVRDVILSPSFLYFLIFSLISFLARETIYPSILCNHRLSRDHSIGLPTLVYLFMLLLQLLQKLHEVPDACLTVGVCFTTR